MDPLDYLRALRRRWPVIVLAVLLAVSVGFVATRRDTPRRNPGSRYRAEAILVSTNQTGGTSSDGAGRPGTTTGLQTLASIVTIGDVPIRVAEELGTDESPLQLAQRIRATADSQTQLLRISTTSTNPDEAETLANTFATELTESLEEQATENAEEDLAALRPQIQEARGELADLNEQLKGAGEGEAQSLQNQVNSKSSELTNLEEERDDLLRDIDTPDIGIEILQEAVATQLPQAGLTTPQRAPLRMGIAALIGLILGVVLVIALERYDTRLATRTAAEGHFRLPVLAEVPLVPRLARKNNGLGVFAQKRADFADSIRLLAASIDAMLPDGVGELGVRARSEVLATVSVGAGGAGETASAERDRRHRAGDMDGSAVKDSRVILVTSSRQGEGKSTVAANLAVTMSEMGRTVLVLSCDFRRPTIHRFFDIPNEDGFADTLGSNGKPVLNGCVKSSSVPGVEVVASGSTPERPLRLLSSRRMELALAEARDRADVVLLDSSPVSASGDGLMLLSQADAVLIVARAEKTTAAESERTREIVSRLHAPVTGVVFNCVRGGFFKRLVTGLRRGFPRLSRHARSD